MFQWRRWQNTTLIKKKIKTKLTNKIDLKRTRLFLHHQDCLLTVSFTLYLLLGFLPLPPSQHQGRGLRSTANQRVVPNRSFVKELKESFLLSVALGLCSPVDRHLRNTKVLRKVGVNFKRSPSLPEPPYLESSREWALFPRDS